ncbi:MAG: CBS domain-containing protein, partial [Phycisphaeraceae bacterium]|nr:CBS domain-containing protein [Phycisphaeraceae bacterium]
MGLHQNLLDDPIAEIELRQLITLPADATIADAVSQMQTHRLGCVAVLKDDGTPEGVFTERRLLALLSNRGGAVVNEPIGDHLNREWICVKRTEPVAHLLDLMCEQELRFVGVLDEDGRAVGLTGQKGLIEYIADH